MGKKIGIDLGTTYSCVSCVDDNGVTRIIDPAEGGGYTTPSVVYFDPDSGEAVVGSAARQEGALHPECMVERVKNYMGDPNYILNVNGQDYSPAAISSLILKKLIGDAECWLGGEEIEGAIITCPAYFGDAAREATRIAGENVVMSNGQKLKVLQILDEPVAAALAYGDSRHEDMQKNVLVYDLGGGTFDVTVMKLNFVGDSRNMEVITTDGNHQLGGKDWDAALSDYVRNKFCELTGADADEMQSDPTQIQWFSENIEKTKIMLTKKESAILIPSFNGNKEKIEITREIFDTETESLLNQTIQLIDDMMDKKGLSVVNDIDEIILVGGSTRMPQVEKRLQLEYNKPITSYEPDKAVAMGAALVANGIKVDSSVSVSNVAEGEVPPPPTGGTIVIEGGAGVQTEIIVKCTKSYGLLAVSNGEDVIANIIMKDTEKPTLQMRRFGTAQANQSSINLRVFENNSLEENATVEESVELYENCIVELTPGLPANAPIEITFNLDASGILVITALDVTNNISKEVRPVRVGGDVNNIGMDAIIGTVLR
ncbi:MAG: Hsp70 family protein [Clostridia bacterium]|nr:Hsp70 family protein [Clostridia bacterium]